MLKRKIVILATKGYEVTDKTTGEVNSGISVYYHGAEGEFKNFDSTEKPAMLFAGVIPEKASLPTDIHSKLVEVPAIYEGDFDIKTGSDLKTKLVLKDVDFISRYEMTEKKSDKIVK